jgi:hypothetical protein
MPNYSARDMLLRMANGGSVGVATSALNNIVPTYGKNNATAADLLAAEQRILGEIAADPSSWDPAVAYNAILESGVTIEDALAAGVQQSTIDAIFTSGAPLPVTAFSTPSTVTSAYESAPYAGQDMQPFYTQAQNYVAGLMADGVIDEAERREAQTLATQGGYTFQDILAAGVDPSILFNVPAAKKTITCPEGYTYDEAVGACVQDKVKEVIPSCPEGYTYDSVFKACVKDVKNIDCPTGYRFDEATQSCVEIFKQVDTDTGSGADSATGVVAYDPTDFGTDPSIYAPGEEALDRVFRDSAPRTEVTQDIFGTQQLTGFDYRPAAELLSATGSGFSWTPPSVTSRPRSLMNTNTLNRYTQGRAAQDLRQLVGNQTIDGVTPEQRYQSYAGLLGNTGSYGGGLSRSQLFALKRQQDSQRKAAPEAGSTTGTIADYLAKYEDVRTDYARAKAAGEIPANQTPEAFARNHYNKYGRFDRPFTLVEDTGDTGGGQSYTSPAIAGFGEGDEESRQSNFTTRGYDTELLARDLGTAGGARIVPVFAEGGPVKKSKGSASTDLEALGKYANGGLIDKAIQKGAEALGFDDERQVAISQEAVDLTNQMVDAGLIGEQYRVELLMPKDASQRTRQNTGIKGDEEVFNAVNHALFAYDAGQSPLSSIGAQAKEVYQGLNKKMGGSDPRSEYLDYFNNKFGFNLAKQGLSRQEAKNAIMDTLGNINNQGTRGRLMRGEPVQAGQDLLTNVEDAKYPWE